MKKFKTLCAAAAAFGLAAQVHAGHFAGSTDFEGSSPLGDGLWSGVSEDTTVQTDDTVSGVSRPANLPASFGESRTKVLEIDTDQAIVRSLNDGGTAVSDGIYADVLVKGTALANEAVAPTNNLGQADKLLVYFRVNQAGDATNMCVFAKAAAESAAGQEFVLSNKSANGGWHRVVIAADGGAYKLYLDGYGSDYLCKAAGDKDTFYSLSATTSIAAIGFKGTGSVDDLVLSTWRPDLPVSTLEWDTSFASVSYVVDNVTNALDAAAGSYEFQAESGSAVTLVCDTGYRTVTDTGTASSLPLTLEVAAPTGLAWFSADASGSGTEQDPYTIPTYGALVAMKDAVAGGTGNFRSAYYVQTGDIALEAAWPGIGIQNGKDLASPDTNKYDAQQRAEMQAQFDAGAFQGTYDGGNFTISNFQMVDGLDYCGFFNSAYNATIKNLKISYKDGSFAKDMVAANEACGAAFVGVAKASTLQSLTTLAGTVSCTKGFGGIVGYLMAGSTVDSCTNNVNLTSTASNKAGGIAMIAQGGSGVALITNCVNNGTTAGNANQKGGIVGYVGIATTIADCTVTAASAPSFLSWNKGDLTVTGENKAPASAVPCKTTGGAVKTVSGLTFALVDNGVATFVADSALAAGDTYLLGGNVAASETPVFTLAAAGDTIAFDTALGCTFAGTVASGVANKHVASATSGTVTTYSLATDQYNVTFVDEDGETVLKAATAYDYGTPAANVVAPEDPTKAATAQYAYTFAGWSPAIAAVTADATYTATYSSTVNKYTVSWDANGGSLSGDYTSGSVDYGTAIVAPTATKAATVDKTFAFAGWTPAVDATVTSNATYTATWNEAARTYTITWTDHSGTVDTEPLGYGDMPTAPSSAPAQYVESGVIYTGTWPTPTAVTGPATYEATYTGTDAKATVITITGATTNTVGTYATLAEAVRAANDGDTVVLLADETADATKTTQADRLVVTNQITIDFGEYTYSVPGSLEPTDNWCAIFIDADTVVKGTTGGIDCLDKEDPSDPCGVYAFNVRNNAKLTIEGGVYHGGGTVVQAQLGTVEINGGTFSVTPFDAPYGYDFALNCLDSNYQAGNAGFEINGGTFVGFDPQDNGSEGAGTDYTADDYVAIDDGNGNFVVQPGYNVTFDADGGTPAPAEQRVVAGGKATLPTEPAKEGYTFDGWTLGGAAYDFDTVLSGDIELVAAWTENTTPAVEPEAVDPGSSLTPADIASGIKPAAMTSSGFEVKFRGQVGVTYVLVSSDTPALTDEGWKAASPAGEAVTCADADQVITLTDSNTSATTKFYKIKAYVAE